MSKKKNLYATYKYYVNGCSSLYSVNWTWIKYSCKSCTDSNSNLWYSGITQCYSCFKAVQLPSYAYTIVLGSCADESYMFVQIFAPVVRKRAQQRLLYFDLYSIYQLFSFFFLFSCVKLDSKLRLWNTGNPIQVRIVWFVRIRQGRYPILFTFSKTWQSHVYL